jgi:catechol 2,3-dioxygenase-like lactoylglutathione lyase family enzyme
MISLRSRADRLAYHQPIRRTLVAITPKSISWLGVTTPKFAEMRRFYEQVFGLEAVYQEPGFVLYRLENGTGIEIFSDEYEGRGFFKTGPVAGFEVEDVAVARAEMEARGIEFITPLSSGEGGAQWSHFRGPDGNIYEITRQGS